MTDTHSATSGDLETSDYGREISPEGMMFAMFAAMFFGIAVGVGLGVLISTGLS